MTLDLAHDVECQQDFVYRLAQCDIVQKKIRALVCAQNGRIDNQIEMRLIRESCEQLAGRGVVHLQADHVRLERVECGWRNRQRNSRLAYVNFAVQLILCHCEAL